MKSTKDSLIVIPFFISLLVTLFLFYIDEGYYDFRWMKDPGNWVVFALYVIVIYAVLLAVFLLVAQVGRWVQRLSSNIK